MTINLIIAATLGALYGIVQGMCMVKPLNAMHNTKWIFRNRIGTNPENEARWFKLIIEQFDLGIRGHRWFKYWHLIFGAFCVAFAAWIGVTIWNIITGAMTVETIPMKYTFENGMQAIVWNDLHIFYSGLLWESFMAQLSTICLQLIVIWTFVEPCYNLTRYGSINSPHGEHVNLWDLKVRIPWIHKITWTEIEKADRPTHEVSAYNNTMTVSVYSTDEWEVEKSKWSWHTIQILPFHAASWIMHAVRIGLVAILTIKL